VPLVAVGGITLDRSPPLVGWADAIAVIGDLLPAAETRSSTFDRAPVEPGTCRPNLVSEGLRIASDLMGEVAARAKSLHELFATMPAAIGATR
jgi:hypothetical protein